MHQFTDDSISEVFLEDDGIVYIYPNLDHGCIALSKEDLLHLLKLIEETN